MRTKKNSLTPNQKYNMYLSSYYNLRSELKFKAHELTLEEDKYTLVLKDIKTGKMYYSSIFDTLFVTADEFIKNTKSPIWSVAAAVTRGLIS